MGECMRLRELCNEAALAVTAEAASACSMNLRASRFHARIEAKKARLAIARLMGVRWWANTQVRRMKRERQEPLPPLRARVEAPVLVVEDRQNVVPIGNKSVTVGTKF